MRRLLVLLSASVVIGVISMAGPAHADPDAASGADSAAFLDSLRAAGITYSRVDLVIATAEAVCKAVGSGKSGAEVLQDLQVRNPGLKPEHGAQFLAIAMRSYCPQQLAPASTEHTETGQGTG